MQYNVMTLMREVDPGCIKKLNTLLKEKFSGDASAAVKATRPDTITISFPDYEFHLVYETPDYEEEESDEFAELVPADDPDYEDMIACKQRIMLTGEGDDDMKHYNDYSTIIEALETLEDVYMLDLNTGELLGR
jgi:hypothetical protein